MRSENTWLAADASLSTGERRGTHHSVFNLRAPIVHGTLPLFDRAMTGEGTQHTVILHDTRARHGEIWRVLWLP